MFDVPSTFPDSTKLRFLTSIKYTNGPYKKSFSSVFNIGACTSTCINLHGSIRCEPHNSQINPQICSVSAKLMTESPLTADCSAMLDAGRAIVKARGCRRRG